MSRKYYHITDPANVDSITLDGLLANEYGAIFLFEDKTLQNRMTGKFAYAADLIAMEQIGLTDYAMFEIDPGGLECELAPDNVAEYSAGLQWIARQDYIDPVYINFCGIYKADGWLDADGLNNAK